MRKISRLFALFLALSMTASCGASESGSQADTSDTQPSTAAEPEVEPEETFRVLPDRDFNGKTLRVVTSDEYAYQVDSETQTGEVTNDAIHARNQKLEEKYNFTIESIINGESKWSWYNPIIKTVLAGDDSYDLVGHFAYSACGAIVQNVFKNWLEMPHISIESPWWNTNINESATINDRLFAITGYLSTSVMQSTYAMFVNSELAEQYGHTRDSLYKTVNDGKWTIDYFKSVTRDMYKDLDGDSKRSLEDMYGYATMPDTAPDIWLAAFNQPITSKKPDGTISIEINTEKTVEALDKLLDMFYNSNGVLNLESLMTYESYYGDKYFAQGNSVFVASTLSAAYSSFRDMKSDYGILPIPKWEDSQERYYTHIMDKYTIWGTPVTIKDEDFVGFVTEALCEESYLSVYPAFYDVALKNKYSSDAATAEMVDLLMEGVTFDFAFMFGSYCGSIQTLIRDLIRKNDSNFASAFAEKTYKLDELYAVYRD